MTIQHPLAAADTAPVPASSGLALRATPQRLSESVSWLLAHESLDSTLRANGDIFPAFMDRLQETLDRAFAEQSKEALFEIHRSLFYLYEDSIGTPQPGQGRNQYHPFVMRIRNEIESRWEAFETERIDVAADNIPNDDEDFIAFVRELCEARSLANHPLFDFLERDATQQQVVEFFRHEGVLILRFCDLMVLSLLGVDENVRGELAINLWDEVGNGDYKNRHTELFRRLLRYADAKSPEADDLPADLSAELDWQGLAGYNLYVFLGLHRRNFFKFIGGMGAAEYMDPPQYEKILKGCRRVGLTDSEALAYYAGHAELDVEHGEAWFADVMAPLIKKYPAAKYDIVAGSIMRINTTVTYYDSLYRKLARR